MPGDRAGAYRRLLRWYPASWRQENEDVMLGTLEDAADSSGRSDITPGEAWSIRLHGLGERMSVGFAFKLAIAALILLTAAAVVLLTVQPPGPWAWIVTIGIAPILLSLSAAAVLRHAGVLTPPTAVGVAAGACLAWSLALLAFASWSVGFDEADAGLPRTLFGELFLPLFAASCLLGTVAMAPVWVPLLRPVRRAWARWSAAVGISALCVVPIGLTSVTPVTGLVVAIGLAIIAQRMRLGVGGTRRPTGVSAPPPAAVQRGRHGRLAWFSGASAVLGLLCMAFALGGSVWLADLIDGTRAMNVGLAAGALAAIPLVLGAGISLAQRLGWRVWLPASALIAALVVVSAGQFAGAGHPMQWPLMLTAAGCLGIGAALVLSRWLPGSRVVRSILTLAAGAAAAATIGVGLVVILPFITPFAAVAVAILALRQRRGGPVAEVS
jgi:hypothetical protein